MNGREVHQNLSRRLHNLIWRDCDQTLCSRAHYHQFIDWRWRWFRVAMDALFSPVERDHCRRSFNRYW